MKYVKEIIILILACLVVFFATRSYRSNQVLNLENQIKQQDIFIQTTRDALIKSKLNPQMLAGFNALGWNLPETKIENKK